MTHASFGTTPLSNLRSTPPFSSQVEDPAKGGEKGQGDEFRLEYGIPNNILKSLHLLLALVFLLSASSFAQRFIDPNKGNIIYTKKGIMDGNNVRTIYLNHGEIALYPNQPSGEWPKGTGHTYIDGISVVVQAETRGDLGKNAAVLAGILKAAFRQNRVTRSGGLFIRSKQIIVSSFAKIRLPEFRGDGSRCPDTRTQHRMNRQ